MTPYGLHLWIKDVYELFGTEGFLYQNLPSKLKSFADLRQASSKGYLKKAGEVHIKGSSYATIWCMTAKAVRRFE